MSSSICLVVFFVPTSQDVVEHNCHAADLSFGRRCRLNISKFIHHECYSLIVSEACLGSRCEVLKQREAITAILGLSCAFVHMRRQQSSRLTTEIVSNVPSKVISGGESTD